MRESFFFAWAGGDNFSGVGHKTFDNPKAFYYLCQSKNFKIAQ